jgi:hypothetical protein
VVSSVSEEYKEGSPRVGTKPHNSPLHGHLTTH